MQINDRKYEYLGSLGFTGSLPDRVYQYLGSLGYKGSINDRIRQNGGDITPPIATDKIINTWGSVNIWLG